ncbi:hypothetical protein J6590_067454 [Homalodisca vitripennis]|nr:hypothetical protein J6590_067454 [Homalodisca vitripennis]
MYTCTVHNMQGCTDVLLYTWGVLYRAGRPRINSGKGMFINTGRETGTTFASNSTVKIRS